MPHDPDAFTQGLVIAGGVLYEGTGLYGASSLRAVDPETGEVLRFRALGPEFFGEGIAVIGDRIFHPTWWNGACLIYDRETFADAGSFAYAGQGWGLAAAGGRLMMSDGSNELAFRDPDTFAEVGRVAVRDGGNPVPNLNEPEVIGGEVWANVWPTDRVARIDPASGCVLGWIDLTGLLPPADREGRRVDILNGLAHDAATGRTYATGKLWSKLFEIGPA